MAETFVLAMEVKVEEENGRSVRDLLGEVLAEAEAAVVAVVAVIAATVVAVGGTEGEDVAEIDLLNKRD